MGSFADYFDIRRPHKTLPLGPETETGEDRVSPPTPSKNMVWPQWLALLAGVLIQPSFEGYRNSHHWSFPGFGGWFWFSVVTSVLIFPGIYRKVIDEEAPILVQLAPIFAAGLGWQSLLSTVVPH